MDSYQSRVEDVADWVRREGYTVLNVADDTDFIGDLIVAVDGRNEILVVRPEHWIDPSDQLEMRKKERRALWRESGGQIEVVRSGPEAMQFLRYGLGSGLE